MSPKTLAKQDTKTALLDAGMSIMQVKGYTNTGIQEVLSTLGVPKGSFYHYFESKENFALEIIRHVARQYEQDLAAIVGDVSMTPVARMRAYCERGKTMFLSQECRKGCLIGNLSQEMSDQSEVLRKELCEVTSRQLARFTECIKEGQEAGEISKDIPAEKLADLFFSAWGGAVMRAKTVKNIQPLETVIEVIFKTLLSA